MTSKTTTPPSRLEAKMADRVWRLPPEQREGVVARAEARVKKVTKAVAAAEKKGAHPPRVSQNDVAMAAASR